MFSMISFLFIDEKIGLLDDFSWQQESDPVCWSKNFDILLSVGRFERRVPCFFFFWVCSVLGGCRALGCCLTGCVHSSYQWCVHIILGAEGPKQDVGTAVTNLII